MAYNRPSTFRNIVTTDTTANSLIVGGATGNATAGTGGIKAGPITASTVTTTGLISAGTTLAAGTSASVGTSLEVGTTLKVGTAIALDGATPATHGIKIPAATPSVVTSALYSPDGASLYYNGSSLATGSSVSGTAGTLCKFTAPSTIGDSLITESGTTLSMLAGLHVQSGRTPGLWLGADVNALTLTNVTEKYAIIALPHYTNATDPMCLLFGDSGATTNVLNLGGGITGLKAATSVVLYTAANATTDTGTARWTVDASGNFLPTGNVTIGVTGTRVYQGWFADLTVTNAIAGNITGYAAGLAVTSQAAGDIYYATAATTTGRVAKGTAYQVLMMNSGATAPEWTSTLGVTGTRLTYGYFLDLAVTNTITGSVSGTAATVTGGTQASITTCSNLTTVGALNSGSITSGFGSIDTGADAISGGMGTFTPVAGGDAAIAARGTVTGDYRRALSVESTIIPTTTNATYGLVCQPKLDQSSAVSGQFIGLFADIGTLTGTAPAEVISLYVTTPGYGTTKYGIYQNGAGLNYFGGNVTMAGSGNSVGTITSGIWNAGAVTSSGGVTASGRLSKFGASSEVYTYDETLNFFYAADSDQTGYINYLGYNNGTTRYRNLVVADGKSATIATFTGSTKAVTFAGGISATTGTFSSMLSNWATPWDGNVTANGLTWYTANTDNYVVYIKSAKYGLYVNVPSTEVGLVTTGGISGTTGGFSSAVTLTKASGDVELYMNRTVDAGANSWLWRVEGDGRMALRDVTGAVTALSILKSSGNATFAGTLTVNGGVAYGGVISPAAVGGTVNDWNPTGLATARVIRVDGLNTPSTPIITGITAQAAGTVITLVNISASYGLEFKHNNVGSSAGNRMLIGSGDTVLLAYGSITLIYDGTTSMWRAIAVEGV